MEAPALAQLIGGYFHQDWTDEFASVAEAVSAFISNTPDLAPELPAEIKELLRDTSTDAEVESYLDGLGNQYTVREGEGGYRGWLASIAARVRAATSQA
ncbi:contact-dependent growth inhibition system immunity protein [Nocardioides sp. GCM10027113]|uniref:contact-dependent growth inhibition system immunity protein n=1 Tax=unclassified Nocardioides TaxID=2615069 RepID=UPI003609C3D2